VQALYGVGRSQAARPGLAQPSDTPASPAGPAFSPPGTPDFMRPASAALPAEAQSTLSAAAARRAAPDTLPDESDSRPTTAPAPAVASPCTSGAVDGTPGGAGGIAMPYAKTTRLAAGRVRGAAHVGGMLRCVAETENDLTAYLKAIRCVSACMQCGAQDRAGNASC
jgi:hypothetical protein